MHPIYHNYSTVNYDHFIFNHNTNRHLYGLRNETEFFVPRFNYAIVKKMPLVDFPSLWNNTDQSLTDLTSKLLFKKHVKSSLLDKYQNFKCNRTLCVSCMNIN